MKKKITVWICVCLLSCSGCGSLVSKGADLLEEERYEEAAEQFQAAIEKGKSLSQSYEGLGIAYMELEEYEKAVQALEQALEEGAEETAVLCNLLGVSSLRSEQYQKAAEYFEKGLAAEGAGEELTKEMLWNRIVSYERAGEAQMAKEKLEEYLQVYPDDETALKEQEFFNTQCE